jgi:glutathione S-transferase
MSIVLYYSPIACSLVPYVTLTEAGAKFEVRNVNLRNGEQNSPDYLKVNPKHKVPVLMVDGQTLTENVATQIWIARHFPQAQLLPTDSWQELQAISIMSWCASGIHPFLARTNAPSRVCDMPGAEESVRRLAAAQLHENYQIADDLLARREYFFEHFTAADAHFFWCFRRGTQFELDLSKYRNCQAHFERLQSRPSVQQCLAHEKTVQAEFAKAA